MEYRVMLQFGYPSWFSCYLSESNIQWDRAIIRNTWALWKLFFSIGSFANRFSCPRVLSVCIRLINYVFTENKSSKICFYDLSLQVYRLNQKQNVSLSNLGNINWENLACLGIIYLICYFSMWKGVKTSGKVRRKTFQELIFLVCNIQRSFGSLPYSPM